MAGQIQLETGFPLGILGSAGISADLDPETGQTSILVQTDPLHRLAITAAPNDDKSRSPVVGCDVLRPFLHPDYDRLDPRSQRLYTGLLEIAGHTESGLSAVSLTPQSMFGQPETAIPQVVTLQNDGATFQVKGDPDRVLRLGQDEVIYNTSLSEPSTPDVHAFATRDGLIVKVTPYPPTDDETSYNTNMHLTQSPTVEGLISTNYPVPYTDYALQWFLPKDSPATVQVPTQQQIHLQAQADAEYSNTVMVTNSPLTGTSHIVNAYSSIDEKKLPSLPSHLLFTEKGPARQIIYAISDEGELQSVLFGLAANEHYHGIVLTPDQIHIRQIWSPGLRDVSQRELYGLVLSPLESSLNIDDYLRHLFITLRVTKHSHNESDPSEHHPTIVANVALDELLAHPLTDETSSFTQSVRYESNGGSMRYTRTPHPAAELTRGFHFEGDRFYFTPSGPVFEILPGNHGIAYQISTLSNAPYFLRFVCGYDSKRNSWILNGEALSAQEIIRPLMDRRGIQWNVLQGEALTHHGSLSIK